MHARYGDGIETCEDVLVLSLFAPGGTYTLTATGIKVRWYVYGV